MKKAQVKKPSAFAGLGDMMSFGGLDDIIEIVDGNKPTFSRINRTSIRIQPQQRNPDEMESEEQTIAELAASIAAEGLISPIVLVALGDGTWRLVCGERRVRACALINYDRIEALCYDSLTDEQIERIQYAENVHRLNLSQVNEAQVLKSDIDRYGTIEAVMEIRNKSRSWISKRLSLLDLPLETTRLLTENITSDLEVIGTVRQIEKIDPAAAAAVVEELKENRGKKGVKLRDTANKAKNQVKPPKKEKQKIGNSENIALPKDTGFMDAGAITSISVDSLDNYHEEQQDFQFSDGSSPQPVEKLDEIYSLIYDLGHDPKSVFDALLPDQRTEIKEWLHTFYDAGTACKNIGSAVIQGFRTGSFGVQGHAAFALVAFLNGGESDIKFNPLDIIGTVKR